MNNDALELAILNALNAQGASKEANKAYLEFIKANFMIPIEKDSDPNMPEVLYLNDEQGTYLPVFSNREIFDAWGAPIQDKILILSLSGVDLLKGIGDNINVCLNIGSTQYKLFNPQEIARMKNMVLKFFKN